LEPTIDCRDLFLRLGDDEILIVDCRDDCDWDRFGIQIPGALKMTPDELRQFAQILPDDELIVLCGCSNDGSDARRAYRTLKFRGRDAVCLDGGLRGWVSNGYPTERRMPQSLAEEALLSARAR
jgi:rhodanese-related sulfurtransferase